MAKNAPLSPEDLQAMILQAATQQGQGMTPYDQALQEFSGLPRGPTDFLRAGTDLADIALNLFGGTARTDDPFFGFPSRIAEQALDIAKPEERFEYVESQTGKLLYKNGVIVDLLNPTAPPMFQNPNDPSVQGSPAWLQQARETWSDEKIGAWRKRLSNQGYQVSPKGGWAEDLRLGLRDYHYKRYFNYGKAEPLTPETGFREQAKQVYNRQDAEADARALYFELYGDEGRPEEIKRLTDGYLGAVTKALRKGVSPERAAQRGQEAVGENLMQDPGAQKFLELEETDTALHDSFVNMFQVFKMLGSE